MVKNLNDIIQVMKKCKLFTHFDENSLSNLLKTKNTYIRKYGSSDIVFAENENCRHLSVLLKGKIEIQKLDSEGNILTVSTLEEGNVFGENLLFGDKNIYPMSVVCKTNSEVIHISKEAIYQLCEKDHEFLRQLLRILSNKAMALSSKLKQVSMRSLRQMICHFIMVKYNKTGDLIINLNMSKKDWAERLGVQRPSLSRELMKMKEDGLIDYDRKHIKILDIQSIQSQE